MSGAPDNPQSLNPYVYVRNNPVNLTDPSGYGPGYNGRIESFADGFKALAIMTATMVGLPALVQGAGYVAPIAFASAPVVQKVVPRVAPAAQRVAPAAGKCEELVLGEASAAAYKAAEAVDAFTVSNKHLMSAGGTYAKFATDSVDVVRNIIRQSLTSSNARFLPNNRDGSFTVITDMGYQIGTKGQTAVKAIVGADGRVWTAYPVK